MNREKPFSPKLAMLVSSVFALPAVACGGGGSVKSNVKQVGGAGGTGDGLGDYACDSLTTAIENSSSYRTPSLQRNS